MKSTFEGIGKGYRYQAGIMLSQIEQVLPDIGIRKYVYTSKGCRLHAYKKTANGNRYEIVFTAHPAAKYIEIKIRNPDNVLSDNKQSPIARIHLRETKKLSEKLKRVIKELILLSSNTQAISTI